ncbi:hypothetical protein ERJ75_000255900 [Trypanosoma vivax]|nr:hypothetical protein ERJ75_000255900 [Trypanosoma vivax]
MGHAATHSRTYAQTRLGPENSDAASETRGPTEAAAKRRAVPGTPGCQFEQPREVCGPRGGDARGVAGLPRARPRGVGDDKAPRPLFNGHSVLRRPRIAGADAEEEQRRLPLRKACAWTLPLGRARRRLNDRALRRFAAVCPGRRESARPNASRG